MITEDMLPAMQGGIPSVVSTISKDGTPNVSYISQVFPVDEKHLALSNQFFSKTMKNIQETGKASVNIILPEDGTSWYLQLSHKETQTEGDVFDEMRMQLDVIASMTGMQDVFKLAASEVFEVISVEKVITK